MSVLLPTASERLVLSRERLRRALREIAVPPQVKKNAGLGGPISAWFNNLKSTPGASGVIETGTQVVAAASIARGRRIPSGGRKNGAATSRPAHPARLDDGRVCARRPARLGPPLVPYSHSGAARRAAAANPVQSRIQYTGSILDHGADNPGAIAAPAGCCIRDPNP